MATPPDEALAGVDHGSESVRHRSPNPLRQDFAMIPTPALSDQRLRPRDVIVLAALASFRNAGSGKCYPSRQRIADAAGCGLTTATTSLRRLEVAGWITRTTHMRPGGGKGSTDYRIPYLDVAADGGKKARAVTRDGHPGWSSLTEALSATQTTDGHPSWSSDGHPGWSTDGHPSRQSMVTQGGHEQKTQQKASTEHVEQTTAARSLSRSPHLEAVRHA
jgi:hypothetical protein